MAFSLKTFLIEAAEIAPAAIALAKSIDASVPTSTKTQILTSSFQAAGGLANALSQQDPTLNAEIQAANQIAASIIAALAAPAATA